MKRIFLAMIAVTILLGFLYNEAAISANDSAEIHDIRRPFIPGREQNIF
ncbi:hypothetical protein [Amphibacillus sediminis]|nr:hypothetical protein [Amphibacillus sediminis]